MLYGNHFKKRNFALTAKSFLFCLWI